MANDFVTLLKIKQNKLDPEGVVFDDDAIEDIDKDFVYYSFNNITDALHYFFEMDEGDASNYSAGYSNAYFGEMYDCYNADEDFDEGYIFASLNDKDALNLLYKIITTIKPDYKQFFKDKEGVWDIDYRGNREIAKLFKTHFPKETDSITNEYCNARDTAMEVGFKNFVNGEFDKFKKILPSNKWFETYEIPIDDLMSMYLSTGKLQLTIKEMLNNYLIKTGIFGSESWSAMHENEDSDTFNRLFQLPVYNILDSLYDEMLESGDYDEDYFNVVKQIEKIGGFNHNIHIKTKSPILYQLEITGVEPETKKVLFKLIKGEGYNRSIKKGKAPISTVLSMLNNYQLFDFFD